MDDTQKLIAALSYVLWPVALVLLIIQETSKTPDKALRHHAYNALGFFVAVLILSILLVLVAWLPIVGMIVATLFWVAVIVVAIVYAVRAYQGQEVDIPLVTEFLKKNVKEF